VIQQEFWITLKFSLPLRPRRDRDETLQLRRRWPRPWSSRDSQESRELQRPAKTFSETYGETHWQWKKLYGL